MTEGKKREASGFARLRVRQPSLRRPTGELIIEAEPGGPEVRLDATTLGLELWTLLVERAEWTMETVQEEVRKRPHFAQVSSMSAESVARVRERLFNDSKASPLQAVGKHVRAKGGVLFLDAWLRERVDVVDQLVNLAVVEFISVQLQGDAELEFPMSILLGDGSTVEVDIETPGGAPRRLGAKHIQQLRCVLPVGAADAQECRADLQQALAARLVELGATVTSLSIHAPEKLRWLVGAPAIPASIPEDAPFLMSVEPWLTRAQKGPRWYTQANHYLLNITPDGQLSWPEVALALQQGGPTPTTDESASRHQMGILGR